MYVNPLTWQSLSVVSSLWPISMSQRGLPGSATVLKYVRHGMHRLPLALPVEGPSTLSPPLRSFKSPHPARVDIAESLRL